MNRLLEGEEASGEEDNEELTLIFLSLIVAIYTILKVINTEFRISE
jgi:hypothetical protein